MGFDFRLAQGLRSPQKQAEYYCKWAKRSPADIEKAAKALKKKGAPWLAALLLSYKDVPRQQGWLTNALPGAGWHQWGEAVDGYCYRDGKMVGDGSDPCYKAYADLAVARGLTAGYYFSSQDSGHLQLNARGAASDVYSWSYIDAVMRERFADKTAVALSAGVTRSMLAKTPANTLGPTIAAVAQAGFLKDDPALIGARLTPAAAFVLTGTSGTLKRLAAIYNRVGGLLEVMGSRLSLDPVAALAVWYVESGGRDFEAGRPVARFENHKFFAHWGKAHPDDFDRHFRFGGRGGVRGKSWQNHAYRVAEAGDFRPSHVDDQAVEYEAFRLGERLGGHEAACLSASWGGPQILGSNFDACGYASGAELVAAFASDERWQVLGFADFCRDKALIEVIRDRDWIRFGDRYNGDGKVYGPKIEAAFALKAALLALPRQPTGGFAPGLADSGHPSQRSVQLPTSRQAKG
ncbi:MAG: N-acetylmuramidase domain-containing protein [Amaricoccus sp.]